MLIGQRSNHSTKSHRAAGSLSTLLGMVALEDQGDGI